MSLPVEKNQRRLGFRAVAVPGSTFHDFDKHFWAFFELRAKKKFLYTQESFFELELLQLIQGAGNFQNFEQFNTLFKSTTKVQRSEAKDCCVLCLLTLSFAELKWALRVLRKFLC